MRSYWVSAPIRSNPMKNLLPNIELPFLLLSDENHEVASRYGVWQRKKMAGRRITASSVPRSSSTRKAGSCGNGATSK